MKLCQISERELFSEHFNLLRAQFSDHYPISYYYHQNPTLQDFPSNLKLMEEVIQSQLLSGNFTESLRFLALIPAEYFEQSPILHVYQAVAMLFSNHPAEEIHNQLSKAKALDNEKLIVGEITAVQALIQTYLGDQEYGIQLSLKALETTLKENLFFRHIVERNLGIAYTIKGDLRKAAQYYEKLLLSSHKLQNHGGILAAYNYLTYIRKVQGRLSEAGTIYKKAISFIEANGLEENPHSIKILAGYGQLLMQWHEIGEAKLYLRKAIQIAKDSDILMAQQAYQDLSEVFIREHDLRSALVNIQECRQSIQRENSSYFQLINQYLLATEARIHLEAGRINQAIAWLESSGFEDVPPQELYSRFGDQLGYILPIAARIYLAKNKDEEALEVLKAIIPKYLHSGATSYLIRALNSLAITYHKMGDTKKAIKFLTNAIELGKPEDNYGDFLFIGRRLRPLLSEIKQRGIEKEFSGRLLTLLPAYIDHSVPLTDLMNSSDHLSERELDVLQLIAEGMTNQEIAGTLFLSANTIKSHSIKIYRKLQVSNRNQAVVKARLLGILPSKFTPTSQISV